MMSDVTQTNYQPDAVKRIPFYFGPEDKPLLGWLHLPKDQTKPILNSGIVICPPLAVEYMNSYRGLRYVADYFALTGTPALRFDYHGTGDSCGVEEDDNRVESWLTSIQLAKHELQKLTGCKRTGLFGFRMGATLAAVSAEREETDFLISWAAHNSGRKFIREIKLLQMTGEQQNKDETETILEAGGMRYWPQTEADLSKIDITKIIPKVKDILILPVEEQISDEKLFKAWNKETNVEFKPLPGSTGMLIDPHLTTIPHETIKRIVKWVADKTPDNIKNLNKLPVAEKFKDSTEFLYQSIFSTHESKKQRVTETLFHFGSKKQRFGIITETKNSTLPTIIISNSGSNHRVGPSRFYVTLARELSLLGFRCLRLDVPGIGDSVLDNPEIENDEYINASSNEILDAVKQLDSDYKQQHYIFTGLCSGSYFSFHASLELQELHIDECILINPLTFYWEHGMSPENSPAKDFSIWNWYRRALTKRQSWLKLFTGKSDIRQLISAVINRFKVKLGAKLEYLNINSTVKDIDRHRKHLSPDMLNISNNNTYIQFILSRSDPGYDILMTNAGKTIKQLQKLNKLNIKFIENADHTFSKYKPRNDALSVIVHHLKDKYKVI